MRLSTFLLSITLCAGLAFAQQQDYYDKARGSFNDGELDSARFYINKNLGFRPTTEDYFLSAMIHEAENKSLRALADYEAVIQRDPDNLEAYFQKGLIYYNSASVEQAIKDFSYVIDNQSGSETKAVYYGSDPLGSKGTFLTTLQSMIGRVYQYRGLAYQKIGEDRLALDDFNTSFSYDTIADFFINRSQLYSQRKNNDAAISDLKSAIELEPNNYLAWYNLAILDESVRLPDQLLSDESFAPMLNLMGANAYESGDYARSAQYYTKAIENNPYDDLALIGRGKALLRTRAHQQARKDFLKAMQINPSRVEAFYLIGNAFFHEGKFEEAIGFYDQYLSIDPSYGNVWYNAAMSHLSLKDNKKACEYLNRAQTLGMQSASEMLGKHCGNQ